MGKKIKLPLENGLAALCNHIKAIKQTAEQSGSAVSALAEATAESIREIEEILNELRDRKVDRTEIDAIVDRIHAEIFGGEVAATLCSQEGEAIAAQDGAELNAVRKTKKGSG